jgi:myosin heavy subunit
MQSYSGKALREQPPHIYAIAEVAYRAMVRTRRNQSIIVSGDSGAGKTEANKLMLEYLASIASASSVKGALPRPCPHGHECHPCRRR